MSIGFSMERTFATCMRQSIPPLPQFPLLAEPRVAPESPGQVRRKCYDAYASPFACCTTIFLGFRRFFPMFLPTSHQCAGIPSSLSRVWLVSQGQLLINMVDFCIFLPILSCVQQRAMRCENFMALLLACAMIPFLMKFWLALNWIMFLLFSSSLRTRPSGISCEEAKPLTATSADSCHCNLSGSCCWLSTLSCSLTCWCLHDVLVTRHSPRPPSSPFKKTHQPSPVTSCHPC